MTAPRLDKRLRAVVDNIEGTSVADVGCDHGKVAVCALLERRVDSAIACDISQKSLDKAIKLAGGLDVQNIQFRCGDGLGPIADGEVDCVVIAGMGGREIISILSDIPSGIKRFVLVAHRNTLLLRKFLNEKGLTIIKDYVVEQSGKYYDIIVALAGERPTPLSERQLLIGLNTLDNQDFARYVDMLKAKRERLKSVAQKSAEYAEISRAIEAVADLKG